MPQVSRSFGDALSAEPPRTSLGLVTYCFGNAKAARSEMPELPDFGDPAAFIEQAWMLGASAVQIPFGVLPADDVRRIRRLAAVKRIYLEATVSCPKTDSALHRFDAELKTLHDLGITIARTVVFPGRRYEQFKTLDDYHAAEKEARAVLRRALPIAKRNGVRLALENHKDQRTEERLILLQEFSSENLGACLDLGNNIALLEDPVQVAEAFGPWTLTVHFKDQAIREYENGFLLADTPVGMGCIDLARIVPLVRAKQQRVRFHLELITRDALEVPCLNENYWPTLDGIVARDLARQLQTLKERGSPVAFPQVSSLLPRDRVEIERRNIEQSLEFAGRHLGFSA